jgi:energy-coupling factor transporter ATP-binding protein EcfA2
MADVLRAEAVAFAYPQHQRGLKPVSLSVESGEGLFISGGSGCGKSTLARCLTGIIPHLYRGEMQGQVWLGDKRTDQAWLWELSERAGLVFQNPATQMLAASVEDEIIFGLENLGLAVGEIERRVEENLSRFELQEFRKRNPYTLSGGEQQKLALAAVMARNPQVLVLDEPLSMLDTTAAYAFVLLLGELMASGTAIVVCEHRPEYLRSLKLREYEMANGVANQTAVSDIQWPTCLGETLELQADSLRVELGGRCILDGVDLNLSGGKVTAILGRNGSGKTTLLRALAGLQPCQGEISICKSSGQEKPVLGVVFQNPDLQLFNASVQEEILYRIVNPDRDFYDWLVDSLDLRRYELTPPLLLSEGEKRRLALATVLMRSPRHGILLDEPALGQDSSHKEMLMLILRGAAAAGKVVAFATHDLELAAQADQMVIISAGKVVCSGSPREMLTDREVWNQLGLRLPEWVVL